MRRRRPWDDKITELVQGPTRTAAKLLQGSAMRLNAEDETILRENTLPSAKADR